MQQHIKHLHWRAGFGLSPQAWQERQHWTIRRAVDHLFAEAREDHTIADAITAAGRSSAMPGFSEMSGEERLKMGRRQLVANTSNWIQLMADHRSSSLKHRMMLFWHGHFACRVRQPQLALQQLSLYEQHGLGHFRDLVLGIARDPGMIRYLNNQQNRKQQPNENFARELMELFTIGRGHYTEQDVRESARAFTGWSSNMRGEFTFRSFWHDYGQKTFMGRSGNFKGEDIIDMLLERRETAQFITRKIYRHFVNEQIDEQRVQHLAQAFYRSDYHIGKLMYAIFTSDWFYNDRNLGNQIKSPVVLLAGLLRSLPMEFKDPRSLLIVQRSLGQVLFDPPNVAGWPGGKNWIDNSTLLLRLNLPLFLLHAEEAGLRPKDALEATERSTRVRQLEVSVDLSALENWLREETPVTAARQLADYLIVRPVQLPAALERELARPGRSEQSLQLMLAGVLSLPEYQLC